MKKLLIIGARGFGREVYDLATACSKSGEEFTIKGFLDDNQHALDEKNGYPPIIDSVENYQPEAEDLFICALGSVAAKLHYANMVLDKGGLFLSLIHPSVIRRNNVKIGKGCIVQPYSSLSSDVEIGDFVTIQGHSIIGHDSKIGNWCHLNSYVFIGGYVSVEEKVNLCTRATILPKIKIHEGATVGAGSVVISHVKGNCTVFGNPAKKL